MTILVLLFFVIVVCNEPIKVHATQFELTPADAESVERVLAFSDFRFLMDEPEKCPITQFAVNSEGYVALGYDTGSKQRIVVYKDNQYQYGYSFCFVWQAVRVKMLRVKRMLQPLLI